MTANFTNNDELSRYELIEQGLTAFADYRLTEDRVIIDHVETPVPLRGGGTAGRLMQALVDDVRGRGLKVSPICSYAVAWLRRHPETQDLVA